MPGPSGGTWDTGGGMLYSCGGTLLSSGPPSGTASPALGALLARFAFPAASAPRFLLAAICPHAMPCSLFTRSASCALISCAGEGVISLPALALAGLAFPVARSVSCVPARCVPAAGAFPLPRRSRRPAMPFSAQPPASGERYALSASLDNARHLSSLLRAVHFQDYATCLATASGLRVTVEDAKCIQANAFIQVRGQRRGGGHGCYRPCTGPGCRRCGSTWGTASHWRGSGGGCKDD